MKPLFKFETPGKRQTSINSAMDNISDHLIPRFKGSSYLITFRQVSEVGSGILLAIAHRTKKKVILVVPWFRPYGVGKTTTKVLSDYPRLNVHKDLKELKENIKLEKMQQLVHKYQLHFLVILQKPKDRDSYWLGKYEDIPSKYWKLTYRKRKDMLDRIHFPGYEDYDFQNFEGLKKEINKIFKNEN